MNTPDSRRSGSPHGDRPRILLSNGFQPEYELGFANGLAACGEPVLLVGSDRTLKPRLDPRVTFVNLRGSQDPRRARWVKALNILAYWWRVAMLLRRCRPPVVHVIGLFTLGHPLAALAEAWALGRSSARWVLTVHNLLPHDRHTRFNKAVYRRIYRLPDLLMVHTELMRAQLVAEYGVPASRIQVVAHGVDRVLAPDAALRHAERARLQLSPDKVLLLFFGAVAPYKGLDVLLEAMARLSDDCPAHLVVAGMCRDAAYRQRIAGPLGVLQASGRAHWLDGYVAEEQVPGLMQAADLMVMPYRHIDQSGVVFMALSAGLPVLASEVGLLGAMARESGGLAVPPEDPVALAAALCEMLPGIAARDRSTATAVAARHLWSNTLPPLMRAYARLANRQD